MRPALALLALLAASIAHADPYRDAGVSGAFVLLDVRADRLTVIHPELAETRFLPASTFKIPNALIALETGVAPDERFTLRWDGKDKGRPAWNRDHDLASAIRDSALWYFQETARRVGMGRMRRLVRAIGYGSSAISGPIDRFWIDASLRISPREQIDFLRRLRAAALPVGRAHQQTVARLIELERGDGYVLRGKTGLGFQDEQAIGWLVGWVERGDDTYVYASLLVAPAADARKLMELRRPFAEARLTELGALPPRAR